VSQIEQGRISGHDVLARFAVVSVGVAVGRHGVRLSQRFAKPASTWGCAGCSRRRRSRGPAS
jgi:hypothetical protein